ncbi:selenium-binding protein SBP56-related protein [Streptomyces sp. NPDC059680]|uniref:selenium-binding protein SBP56-related protein n=1 Tax=Streptomyces sp. NPDC059680 TaxID=3346904 RepID=UPI0036882963
MSGSAGCGRRPATPPRRADAVCRGWNVPLAGGARMVELSRDGRREYLTNSLYSARDAQLYPAGIEPWMIKLDADTAHGGLSIDSHFFPHAPDFLGLRVHQTRLQGGDASSDSYCYRR